jgi:hypothetical protein
MTWLVCFGNGSLIFYENKATWDESSFQRQCYSHYEVSCWLNHFQYYEHIYFNFNLLHFNQTEKQYKYNTKKYN